MDKKYAAQEAITHSMMGSLGLKLIEEKEGFIRASMPVNDNTSQPFGVLCGGASLAFAEIIAGYGSICAVRKDSFQSEARFLETMLVQCARRRMFWFTRKPRLYISAARRIYGMLI